MGLGDLASPWREPCAWNSFWKRKKLLCLKSTINNLPPPPLSPSTVFPIQVFLGHGSDPLVKGTWWYAAFPDGAVACSRLASSVSSGLRAPPSPRNILLTHLSAIVTPSSAVAKLGAGVWRAVSPSVQASTGPRRHQMPRRVVSSPVLYFWFWGAGSPRKWQPRRGAL